MQLQALPRPRLLAVTRLVAWKNLVKLVEAFTHAKAEGMAGSLTIVGEGPERPKLEPLIARLSGHALLAGAIPFRDARRIFGAFDGMVLPSTFEPWGIVVVEGLASRHCGAGISMALEGGDAVKLCGTTTAELQSSLKGFVTNLDHHSEAAKRFAPVVRRKFGITEVADALIGLAEDSLSSGSLSAV